MTQVAGDPLVQTTGRNAVLRRGLVAVDGGVYFPRELASDDVCRRLNAYRIGRGVRQIRSVVMGGSVSGPRELANADAFGLLNVYEIGRTAGRIRSVVMGGSVSGPRGLANADASVPNSK